MPNWYFAKNGQQFGPVSEADLQQRAASGELRPEDMAWKDGMAEWKPAGSLLPFWTGTVGAAPAPAAMEGVGFSQAGQAPGGYATPLSYQSPGQGQIMLTTRGLDTLRQTRPWVLFLGILMIIAGALYALAGVAGLFGSMVTNSRQSGFLAGQMVGMVIGAVVYIAMGGYLVKYGSKIRTLLNLRRPEDLDAALEAQKSYWRLTGIIAIVAMIVVALVMVLAVGGLMR
jgi:hypothetical protein